MHVKILKLTYNALSKTTELLVDPNQFVCVPSFVSIGESQTIFRER